MPTNPSAKVSELAFDPTQVKLVDYDIAKAGEEKKAVTKRFIEEIAQAPKS